MAATGVNLAMAEPAMRGAPQPTRKAIARLVKLGLTVALFCAVVGANWDTSLRYGTAVPKDDQWDAEGVNLLTPWYTHDHFLAHLFQPHNEHRVILTKLQNLAVTVWGGQWDAQSERLFNALLHGLIAVGLWWLARRIVAPRWRAIVYLVIGALYALPLSWENLLGGFHSQQYWLVGLSFGAIALLPWVRAGSAAWWTGVACAVLVMGAMGSGFFAAAAVIAAIGWRIATRAIRLREVWLTAALMLALVVLGMATRVVVPGNAGLNAHSVGEFSLYVLRSLSWPIRDHDCAGVILWAPWAVAVARLAWGRAGSPDAAAISGETRSGSRIGLLLATLGSWVLLQVLATAYARGSGADYPAPRYMDTLMAGAAVNALAAGWLLTHRKPRVGWYVVGAAWLVAFTAGMYGLVRRNLTEDFPANRTYYAASDAHLRAYLATNDPATLKDEVPYIDAHGVIERLASPSLRAVMPAVVRPPLPLAPTQGYGSGFVALDTVHELAAAMPRDTGLSPATPALAFQHTWGSFGAQDGAAAQGTWESEPLTAALHGWLKFEMAGNAGEPGVALELHDAQSHALLGEVRPSKVPYNSWRSAYVRAPEQPFIVVARDTDPRRWVAFSAPVEMSTLSYWSWRLMKNGLLLAEVAAALAAVLGCVSLVSRLNAWGRMRCWGRDVPVAFSPNHRDGGAAASGKLSPPVASVGPQNQPKSLPSE